MKRIYLFLIMLAGCLFGIPAQAREVVKEIGEMVNSLSQIKVGDKLLFFCNGPVDPSDKEYGQRMAYVREGDENKLYMSRDLIEDSYSSNDFIWTVISYEAVEGDETSHLISLKSPRGNNLPAFPYFKDKKPKWPGRTVAPEDGDAAIYTIMYSEVADSLFYLMDENGIYFNGQSIIDNSPNQKSLFVGWNQIGSNSLYKIFIPRVEEKNTAQITMILNDDIEEREINTEKLLGDTLDVPEWENHTYLNAMDLYTEVPVTFPYIIQEEERSFYLNYEIWPLVTVTCSDADTGEEIYSYQRYIEKGTKFVAPGQDKIGIGYALVTEGYDDYTITQDEYINLEYRKDEKTLPFASTTLENGDFAAGTKWYLLKINGNKVLTFDKETMGVACGEVTLYNDANLWAFAGNLNDGFQIYNKAAGAKLILWASNGDNKTQVFMTPTEEALAPNTFDINFNGNGFSWKLHESAQSYLNDFGGMGILKIWSHANAHKGDGSRFTFTEYTPELAHALAYGEFISYLQAENCVGGWSTADLADLRKAYEQRDTTACRTAVENLAQADTIAFDKNKTYALISAYQEFIASQPGKEYAMAVEADSSLVWKALDETEKAFQFGFNTASDTTFYIVSAANQLPIGGFRFGDSAKCVEWGDLSIEENKVKAGHPAPFTIKKNADTPASYFFIHNYGPSIITLSATPHHDSKATSGTISTYNTQDGNYNNYWRLKPMGEWSAIEETLITTPGQQQQTIYDLSGRKVMKALKGLYIINGKKVYVK